MGSMASQITSLTIVYSAVYSGAEQRKHQSSASLAFVWGIHRGPVNSPHKWPVTRKMIPFDDVIMKSGVCSVAVSAEMLWYIVPCYKGTHSMPSGFGHEGEVWNDFCKYEFLSFTVLAVVSCEISCFICIFSQ